MSRHAAAGFGFPRGWPRAFTLVEILVTVAILGLLVGLSVPAVQRARLSGAQGATTAAMKQIGTALHLYAAENNGTLPGPLSVGVFPYGNYSASDDTPHLGLYLSPYLGLAGGTPGTNRVALKSLRCPALSTAAQTNFIVANYVVPEAASGSAASAAVDFRFGGPLSGAASWSAARAHSNQPKRLVALEGAARSNAFLCTADREVWVSAQNVSLPTNGVFAGKRLWLFLDSSVALATNKTPFAK